MRLFFAVGFSLACISVPGSAHARSFRVQDVPNGGTFSCVLCHGELEAKTFNDFGSLALANLEGTGQAQQKHVSWAGLCDTDPDGDGLTSGEELGDPDCVWTRGDADPVVSPTNPGVPSANPGDGCGDGFLKSDEDCDGELKAYERCIDLHFGAGDLKCTAECSFDYSDCTDPPGEDDPLPEEEGCAVSAGSIPGSSIALLALVLLSRGWRSRTGSSKKG
jgi:hypothetical protein